MARHHLINGVQVAFTAEEETARDAEEAQAVINKQARIDAAPKPYAAKRKAAYPPIGDQLDMLWHSIDESAELKQKYFAFYEALKAVKVKYSK